jgi:hypothetical protein
MSSIFDLMLSFAMFPLIFGITFAPKNNTIIPKTNPFFHILFRINLSTPLKILEVCYPLDSFKCLEKIKTKIIEKKEKR